MRVSIYKNPKTYSSMMYYIRGDWNKISDVNTIIDPGINDFIIKALKNVSYGIGKSLVEQVILTHEHFDHIAGLKWVLKEYSPKVVSYSLLPEVTLKAYDGMKLQIGDDTAKIIHSPGHSHDSICIYTEQSKALFSGDTPLRINSVGASYSYDFVKTLEKLIVLDIKTIYSGHDEPIFHKANDIIKTSYQNVLKSKIL